MKKSLSIKFTADDYEVIKAQAKQSGMSASAIVREAFQRDQDTLYILRALLDRLDAQEQQFNRFYSYSKKVDEGLVKLLKELIHTEKAAGGHNEK